MQTITCDTASGLNCDRSGDTVDVQLDVERLFEATTVEGTDEIPLADDSVGSDPTRKATVIAIGNHFASGNLIADDQGRLYTSAQQNNTRTTLEGGDWFTFGDVNDVEDRKITVENVGQHFADGVTLTHDTTTGALSIAEDVTLPGQARMATPANSAHDTRLATTEYVADWPGLLAVGESGNDGLDGNDLFQVYNHIGGNQVPRQKMTWTDLKEAIAAEVAFAIADNSVGQDELRTGTMTQDGQDPFDIPGDDWSLVPTLQSSSSASTGLTYLTSGQVRWMAHNSGAVPTVDSIWRYFTSSDRPSLWVVLDATGAVDSFWEAEDPVSESDTVAPMTTEGTARRVVNVGLPTFSVIERVYATVLTEDQRAGMLSAWSGYMLRRGWITTPLTQLTDTLGMVPARYEPSSRQWAMRFMAAKAGASVPNFYKSHLVIIGDAWARRE